MKRFEGVRLRPGMHRLGDGLDFVVAETPQAVALVREQDYSHLQMREQAVAADLFALGCPVIVFVEVEGPASAVATCYSPSPDAIEQAACGIWALKTMGSGETSRRMTFHLSRARGFQGEPEGCTHYDSVLVIAQSTDGEAVEVSTVPSERWSALTCASVPSVVVGVDVDWMQAYNEVHGHRTGDLLLARVHGCVEAVGSRASGRCVRAGGDEFALILEADCASATSLAESIRQGVEGMDIPFTHPRCQTHGRVTVSVVVVDHDGHGGAAALQERVEATLYQAKLAGRNAVVRARPVAG